MTECVRLLMNGQFAEALARLRSMDSRTPIWWLHLGLAHLALGELDQARSALTHALQVEPEMPEAKVGLALASYLSSTPAACPEQVTGRARWSAAVLSAAIRAHAAVRKAHPWDLLTPQPGSPIPVVFLAHQDPRTPAGRDMLAAAASLARYGLPVQVHSHWAPPDEWDGSVQYVQLPDDASLVSGSLEGIVFTASPALVYDLHSREEVLPALVLQEMPSPPQADTQSYDRFLSGAVERAAIITAAFRSDGGLLHGRTLVAWPGEDHPSALVDVLGRILWNSLMCPPPPAPLRQPLLSVAMIARDEEQHIWRSLASVKGVADEIIVVDTGSRDATVATARAYGAQVCHRTWDDDFSAARNAAVARCAGRWILWLDADEEVYLEDPQAFRAWLAEQDQAVAALVEIRNLEDTGLWAAEGARGILNQGSVRLARNLPGLQFRGRVHEDWLPSVSDRGPLVYSPLVLYHYGYLKQSHEAKAKAERNLRLIERAVREAPHDGRMRFYLGLERFRRGDYEDALKQFRWAYELLKPEAKRQYQTFDRLFHFWAETLRLTGRTTEALERIREAREYYPENSWYWLTEALILVDQGRYEEALAALDCCRRQGPPPAILIAPEGVHTFQADFVEGLVHLQRRAWDRAARAFEQALRRRPLFPQAAVEYAKAARQAGLASWQDRLETLFASVPGRTRARILGEGFFVAEEYERAAYWYGLAGGEPPTVLRLGVCYLRLGRLDEAEATFRTIPKEAPEWVEATARLCLCCWLAGRWDEAITQAERMAARNRQLGSVYVAMARTAAGVEPAGSAGIRTLLRSQASHLVFEVLEWLIQLQGFTAFERILPVVDSLADRDRLIRLGKLYFRYGFRDLAVETLVRAVQEGYPDADAYLMLGRLAEDAGLAEDAETFYREAVARQPNSPIPYTQLADFLMRSGRAADAVAVLDTALTRRGAF